MKLRVSLVPPEMGRKKVWYTVHNALLVGNTMRVADVVYHSTDMQEALEWAKDNMTTPYIVVSSMMVAVSEGIIAN